MDTDGISIPPAKRQRTLSPMKTTTEVPIDGKIDLDQNLQQPLFRQPAQAVPTLPSASLNMPATEDIPSIPGLGTIGAEDTKEVHETTQESTEDFGILDALMQHVESESGPAQSGEHTRETLFPPNAESEVRSTTAPSMDVKYLEAQASIERIQERNCARKEDSPAVAMEIAGKQNIGAPQDVETVVQDNPRSESDLTADHVTGGKPEHNSSSEGQEQHMAEYLMNGQDTVAGGRIVETDDAEVDPAPLSIVSDNPLPTGEVNGEDAGIEGAEWEIDSSPLGSSSESETSTETSSSEDDSDDEDADGDYAMLDPEEQARILMQGDGGSDDEGGTSKDKADAAPLRTANERPEEIIPKPNIVVTEDMLIEELGEVEGVVENTVLVKAKVSGDYQVLESGSLLCTSDRAVVGVVAETLGRVEQPRYTIRFTNDKAVEEAGLSTNNTVIYYVPTHSTFVFTRPLRAVKGSDASNFHDEEVGDEEMEFSDDEAEAEHKRRLKLKRQGKRDDRGSRGRGNRGARGSSLRNERASNSGGFAEDQNGTAYGNGSLEINYDDNEGADDGYTPLARPANFHEMIANSPTSEAPSHELPPFNPRNSGGRGHTRGSNQNHQTRRGGRGGRARGGRDRSSNGSDRRRSFSNDFSNSSAPQYPTFMGMQNSHTFQSGVNTHQSAATHSQMPPPQNTYQYQAPPHQPLMPPQNFSYPNFPFSPSPISPLPKQQFDFGGYAQQQQQQQQYQQIQGIGTYAPPYAEQMPPPGNHFNPGFMQNFVQQQQHQGPPGPGNYGPATSWTGNQAAAAEVQAQLEQLRRKSGGGQ